MGGENSNDEYTDNSSRKESAEQESRHLADEEPPQELTTQLHDNMEVHHHPHIHHRKKKFSEYIFEFLMLFLAVFLGFLAENLREHYADKKKENQYVTSLMRDLLSDTENITKSIRSNTALKQDYDSLLALLKNKASLQNPNLLYYYFIPTTYYNGFHSTQRTIQQLENSGGMRLIEDLQVSDSITLYYDHVESAKSQFSTYLRYFDIYHAEAFNIFSYAQIDTSFSNRQLLLNLKNRLSIKNTGGDKLDILYSKLYIISTVLNLYIQDLEDLKIQASSLLQFLNKKYNPAE